jgi:tetrahydrodipicolinate N-succinyltransferase
MRVIANNLESLTNHYNGMAKKPDKISADQVTEVLAATESDDDKTAVRFLTALLAGKFVACQKEILSVQDSFGFFNKVLWLNNFLLNNTVLNGERHPKVWTNASGWVFKDNMDKVWEGVERKDRIARLAKVLAFLTKAKAQAGAFQVPEVFLLTTLVYDLTYGESK